MTVSPKKVQILEMVYKAIEVEMSQEAFTSLFNPRFEQIGMKPVVQVDRLEYVRSVLAVRVLEYRGMDFLDVATQHKDGVIKLYVKFAVSMPGDVEDRLTLLVLEGAITRYSTGKLYRDLAFLSDEQNDFPPKPRGKKVKKAVVEAPTESAVVTEEVALDAPSPSPVAEDVAEPLAEAVEEPQEDVAEPLA